MKKYNTRPDGDVIICEREFKDSVSVDLKTPLFGYMKKKGFIEVGKTNPQIVDIIATPIVTANTENSDKAAVEMIGKGTFISGDNEYSVRIEMFTTSCSVQIQVMGKREKLEDFK